MKRLVLTGLLVGSVCLAPHAVNAAPPTKTGGGAAPAAPPPAAAAPAANSAAAKKVVPAALQDRMARQVTKGGVTKTAKEILEKDFTGDEVMVLASGRKVTIQEVLDAYGEAETSARAQRSTMGNLKKKGTFKAGTANKKVMQKAAMASEVRQAPGGIAKAGVIPKTCTADTCKPSEPDHEANWTAQKGDEEVAAVYTSFTVKSSTQDAYATKCTAVWDNGVYILDSQKSLLKFTANLNSKKKPSPSWTADAALYTLGQSTPVWNKNTTVNAEALDRTFSTPNVQLTYAFIPGVITAEGHLKASATLTFRPITKASSSDGVSCTLGVEPQFVGKVNGGVTARVGIGKLVELASAGATGDIKVIDLKIPTSLTATVKETPPSLGLDFESKLDTSLMSGRVFLWYKLGDICVAGKCLVEDVLGIDTYGEYELWEDADGFPYNKTLINKHASIAWESK